MAFDLQWFGTIHRATGFTAPLLRLFQSSSLSWLFSITASDMGFSFSLDIVLRILGTGYVVLLFFYLPFFVPLLSHGLVPTMVQHGIPRHSYSFTAYFSIPI